MNLGLFSRRLFSLAGLSVLVGLGMSATAQQAKAWDTWDDVQRQAYVVEDYTENLYQAISNEARPNNQDEDYALELAAELADSAENFSYEVNRYPWMAASYTSSAYAELYSDYYRVSEALRYTNFSYHVDSTYQIVRRSMDWLRAVYNYRYVSNGWVYVTYRNIWWSNGNRHLRNVYRQHRLDRIQRRLIYRNYFRGEHNRRRLERRNGRRFTNPIAGHPRVIRRWPNRGGNRGRIDRGRDNGRVTPPVRQPRDPRLDRGNRGNRDNGRVTPPVRQPRDPRLDRGNRGNRDNGRVTPPVRQPRDPRLDRGNRGNRDNGRVTPPVRQPRDPRLDRGNRGNRDSGRVTPPVRQPRDPRLDRGNRGNRDNGRITPPVRRAPDRVNRGNGGNRNNRGEGRPGRRPRN